MPTLNYPPSQVRSDMSDVPEGFVLPQGDAVKGHKLFKKHCAQCHSVFPDARPALFGVWSLLVPRLARLLFVCLCINTYMYISICIS